MKKFPVILIISIATIAHSKAQLWEKADSLRNEAITKQNYSLAIHYAEETLSKIKKLKGAQDTLYPYALYNVLEAYFLNNDLDKALYYAEEEMKARKELHGRNSLEYAIAMNNVGFIASQKAKTENNVNQKEKYLEKAEKLWEKAIEIYRDKEKQSLPDYQYMIKDLAKLYYEQKQYEATEKLYLENLQLDKEKYGNGSKKVAYNLNGLAILYWEMKEYEKAKTHFSQSKELYKKLEGTDSPNYASVTENLAGLYLETGDHKKAEKLYLEVKDIYSQIYSKKHIYYNDVVKTLANLYADHGRYSDAEPLYREALEIDKKVYGTSHEYYANDLNNLALLYYNMGRYKEALPLYFESKQINMEIQGKNSPGYATSLDNLGALYMEMGMPEKAKPLLTESAENRKKLFGEESEDYILTRNKLAGYYFDIGNTQKSIEMYENILDVRKRLFGEEHSDYANTLNSLALCYVKTNDYKKAETYFTEALNIREKTLGKSHPSYAGTLELMANMYAEMGNFKKAEPLFDEAQETFSLSPGKNSPRYALLLNNKALLYKHLGNYKKAKTLYLEAKDIQNQTLGTSHPHYATTLNNLALLYEKLAEYTTGKKESEQLYLEAIEYHKLTLEAWKASLGEDHPKYTTALHNIGTLCWKIQQYDKAEKLLKTAFTILEKNYEKPHSSMIPVLNSLALVYEDKGNHEEAKNYYKESIKLQKELFGDKSPVYATIMHNMADFYYDQGDIKQAKKLYDEMLKVSNYNMWLNFSFLSEQEKESYFLSMKNKYEDFNSFAYKVKSNHKEITGKVYNNAIRNKGLLLKSTTAMRQAILNSGYEKLIDTYEQWIALKKKISGLHTVPVDQRKEDPEKLAEKANELEKELVRSSQHFSKFKQLQKLTWQDVQKALQPGEAAIEIVHFNYYSKEYTDTVIYCALVLTQDMKYPAMVRLFDEEKLQMLLDIFSIQELYSKSSGRLYKTIWQPVDSLLKDIKTLYISPSGLLHKISFMAMPLNTKQYLSDKYQLNIVSNAVKIIDPAEKLAPGKNINALVYGGIKYDIDSLQMLMLAKASSPVDEGEFLAMRNYTLPQDSLRGLSWSYLEGTLDEAKNIEQKLSSQNINIETITAENAIEESFKSLSNHSPEIIHVATHGFFFPDAKKKRATGRDAVFRFSDNPLFRSGLLFAGANRVWQGLPAVEGIDDGILTAYEISQLNLDKTKLVVLSACETGLGEIKGSEGVYGLQRAFKMAGVDYLVMSLWQVPDKETVELMDNFYDFWTKGYSIKEAFRKAQNVLKQKYDPFYWAAFVLIY